MDVIYSGSCSADQKNVSSGVALGNFDGVHVGHMALINALTKYCKLKNLRSILYTFDQHPAMLLKKNQCPLLLSTLHKKIDILKSTQLTYLYLDKFNYNFSCMSPEKFVEEVLLKKFNLKLAIAGNNYRFGKKCSGTIETLAKLGEKYGFEVIKLKCTKVNNKIVSSTLIRNLISQGKVNQVYKFLGRNYSLIGKVIRGREVGRSIGFPTANISVDNYVVIPSRGVYITQILVNGTIYDSITNIGLNPTFAQNNAVSIETHIFNFDKNIYNETVEVFFVSFLRKEQKFANPNELMAQINQDILDTKEYWRFRCKS